MREEKTTSRMMRVARDDDDDWRGEEEHVTAVEATKCNVEPQTTPYGVIQKECSRFVTGEIWVYESAFGRDTF